MRTYFILLAAFIYSTGVVSSSTVSNKLSAIVSDTNNLSGKILTVGAGGRFLRGKHAYPDENKIAEDSDDDKRDEEEERSLNMNWLKKLSPKKWKWFKPKKVETKKIMVDGEEFRPLAFLMDDIFPVWKRNNYDFEQAQQVMRKQGLNDDAIDNIWGIYLGQRKVV